MNRVIQFAQEFFGWVLQTTWQAGVLVILVVLAQMLLRRRLSPAWRYWLWLLVVARLLLPAAPPASWSIFNVAKFPLASAEAGESWLPPSSAVEPAPPILSEAESFESQHRGQLSSTTADKGAQSSMPDTPRERSMKAITLDWRRLALLVWLFGAGLFGARLIWSSLRFWQRIRSEPTLTNEKAQQQLASCREILRIRQRVVLIESQQVQSPAVHGLWRKRMLLPKGMLEGFSAEELRGIFLHELAHIKRRDLGVNWLVTLLQVLHWFNPLLWFGFARLRAEREMACDALALKCLGKGSCECYGETIIKVVEDLATPARAPGSLALSEDKHQLQERIRNIANSQVRSGLSVLALVVFVGIAVVGLTNASKARAPGAQTTKPNADATTGSETQPRLKGIYGRVVDAQGNPVINALVRCQGFHWETSSDRDGRFAWVGADVPRRFQIEKSGFQTLFTGLLAPGGNETSLHLKHAPVIGGRVVDAETHQPISTFEVYRVGLFQGPMTVTLNPHEMVQGNSGQFAYSFKHGLWPGSAFCIQAEGHRPILSPPLISAQDGRQLTFELPRDQSVAGRVFTPDGAPASEAQVRLWCGQANLKDIPARHETKTDASGDFSLPPVLDGVVLVYHDSGYAEVPWKEFTATHQVRLDRWGYLKGHWPKPLPANRKIRLERINWSGESYSRPLPWDVSASVKSDGSLESDDKVPAGEYVLCEWAPLRVNSPGGGYSMLVLMSKRAAVLIEPGRTNVAEVSAGRAVVGKVDLGGDESLTNVHLPIIRLSSKQQGPEFPFPTPEPSLSEVAQVERLKEHRKRVLDYWLSEEGKARRRKEIIFELPSEPDGSFRIENVTPGDYELVINAQKWDGKLGPEVRRQVSVRAESGGVPLDLGIVK